MKKKNIDEIITYLKVTIVCYLAVYLLTTFIIKPVVVKGDSMYPTLQDRDVGISYIITRNLFGLKGGDIVTVYIPEEKQYLVKRVIGVPGDEVYAKNDILYVNGQAVDEDYLNSDYVDNYRKTNSRSFTADFEKVIVPEGSYFLMGDNRPVSKDSRFYGSFKKRDILSNSILILYPFSNFGIK